MLLQNMTQLIFSMLIISCIASTNAVSLKAVKEQYAHTKIEVLSNVSSNRKEKVNKFFALIDKAPEQMLSAISKEENPELVSYYVYKLLQVFAWLSLCIEKEGAVCPIKMGDGFCTLAYFLYSVGSDNKNHPHFKESRRSMALLKEYISQANEEEKNMYLCVPILHLAGEKINKLSASFLLVKEGSSNL